jgi:tetratricopeptide (TPR) repeat protein
VAHREKRKTRSGRVEPVPASTDRGRSIAIAAGLIALTLVVFLQVRHFDFVNWDDQIYLTENANVQAGLSWSNVVWALTTTHSPYWHPLTWLSHMLDVTMFGMDAGWHHVTSLVIHIASTLLLFAVFRRMTGEEGKSAFVAAVFAVHPLHVESVAWLAERKDVLSTFFLMVTFWTYVRYVDRPRAVTYSAVVAAYALALMSKPMVVTLPFALLLLDVWPLQRIGRSRSLGSVLVEKLPLLALALIVSGATAIVQKQIGAVAGLDVLPLGARVTNALVGYVMYVWKTIWPTGLAPFYPFHGYPAWVVVGAGLALAAATALAVACWRRWPFVTVGWLWYIVTVAPVIGLMQAGEQARADRFMYVPMIGLSIIVAWGATPLLGHTRRAGVGRLLRPGVVATVLVLGLAVGAHAQTAYWSDSVTLWRRAAEVTQGNYIAYEKIGEALRDQGRFEEAIDNFEQALKVSPANSPVHVAVVENNMGLVRERQRRFDDAERHFAEAARLNPQFAEAQNNYGNALAADGRYDEAITCYRAALVIQPDFTEALIGLGGSLVRLGRPEEAAAQYSAVLRRNPNLAEAHNGLASALLLEHRDDEALVELNRALELKPDLASAHLNIAILLLRKHDTAGARQHLETALSIDPNYEPARNVLARIQ